MKSRLLGGIAALVLAIVGTLMLVNYVSSADRRAQAELNPVDVVVIKKAVPAGTRAEDLQAFVEVKSVPEGSRVPDALRTLSRLNRSGDGRGPGTRRTAVVQQAREPGQNSSRREPWQFLKACRKSP